MRDPYLLTTATAAAFVGLSKSTLNKYRLTGQGPSFVRLGRRVRYEEDALRAWIEDNRRRST